MKRLLVLFVSNSLGSGKIPMCIGIKRRFFKTITIGILQCDAVERRRLWCREKYVRDAGNIFSRRSDGVGTSK